jgi:hypothetical protein
MCDILANEGIAVSLSKIVATAANKHSAEVNKGKTVVVVWKPDSRYKEYTHTG